MRGHLEKAVAMATAGGQASARCDALAHLAVEAARLVSREAKGGTPDADLVDLVERSAGQVKEVLPLLPGHAPWGAHADAALATVALARGDPSGAAIAGGAAFAALQAGHHEDASLEIIVPAARGVFAGAPPEVRAPSGDFLRATLSRIAQGTADEIDPRPVADGADRPRARRAGRALGRAGLEAAAGPGLDGRSAGCCNS
jgi:hypothetical protein